MAKIHHMKLLEDPFNQIKEGVKTLEVRLYDDKRKDIQLGDQIIFSKLPHTQDRVNTLVTGLYRYNNFEELIDDVPAKWLGIDKQDKEYIYQLLCQIYKSEQQMKFGVLGIRIKVIA